MNYATTANRANPLAALGALGVPAAFGAILVVGLAVTGVIKDEDNPLVGVTVPIEPIEPIEPPEPTLDAPTSSPTAPQPVPQYTPTPRPDAPIDIGVSDSGPITTLPGLGSRIDEIRTVEIPSSALHTSPSFAPVAASPRGNPGGWITTNDYRPSWINRGYEGVAGFTLKLDASGRVSDCTITRSTGHSVLDRATCDLLGKRARFEPARGTSGESVAGSFTSTVRWTIPE